MTDLASALPNSHQFADSVLAVYPQLLQLEPSLWLKLINQSLPVNAPPNTLMQTRPGPYEHFFLLLEGTTRAYQTDESGREFTFYRNYPGDICPLNLQCLFNSAPDNVIVQAETAVHGLQISKRAFNAMLLESETFSQLIFSRLSQRFCDLTSVIEDTVFNKLETRLCHLLGRMFQQCGQDSLKITHQQLANELGTTREVISRSLKVLEQDGCLKITRGYLTILSREKLA